MTLEKVFHIAIYIFASIGFILFVGYVAVRFGLTNTKGIIDNQRNSFLQNKISWAQDPEWNVLKEAIIRDKDDIVRAGNRVDINPRIIVAQLVVEQLRLFYSERELFKKVFEPLKVLGNQNKFSWGVMGIKESTAIQIENNLKNKYSPFYLGAQYENILDFTTERHNEERFARLTDENSRYYSYLYTAVYLKQIIEQWKKAGFDISEDIGVLSTLFNIGFEHSKPNKEPKTGGSVIEIDGVSYSFGSLACEFYYSGEITNFFK